MSDDMELRMAWDAMTSPNLPTPAGRSGPQTRRSGPETRRSVEVFDDLVGRHRQAHRHYHGVRHVVWVLRHARRIESAIPACSHASSSYDHGSVTAAAFFHDAIYDPRRTDNEERSARLADIQLASIAWSAARRQIVVALVAATAGHLEDGDGPTPAGAHGRLERSVLLDADLAVLGSDPNAYAGYVNGVRQEYGHLGADEWAVGRAAVLRRLLDRGEQFTTDPARAWWGAAARANMTAELAALTATQ